LFEPLQKVTAMAKSGQRINASRNSNLLIARHFAGMPAQVLAG
jgi:hypothetical protein